MKKKNSSHTKGLHSIVTLTKNIKAMFVLPRTTNESQKTFLNILFTKKIVYVIEFFLDKVLFFIDFFKLTIWKYVYATNKNLKMC